MGTAAQESRLEWLSQLGGGPGLGLWQCEPATHEDIWQNYLRFREELRGRVCLLLAAWPSGAAALASNLAYAAVMCRLQYLRDREPLPPAGDVEAMARTWKRVYNSEKGKGTPAEFVRNWRLVGDLYR